MSWRWLGGIVIVATAWAGGAWCDDEAPADALQPTRVSQIDYARDIQPIFDRHCVTCHSQDQPEAGLRLDRAVLAKQGGASQRPVFGGTLATNELYLRVSSTEPAYRMPKGKPSLADRDIELIRQWVADGCPAPVDEPPGHAASNHAPAFTSRWDNWLKRGEAAQLWVYRNPFAKAFLYVGLVLLILTLIWPRVAWLPKLRPGYHILFWTVYLSAFLHFQQYGTALAEKLRANDLQTEVDRLQEEKRKQEQPTFFEQYGRPPVPTRLRHPKSLSRTYYRGNCERDASLFNSGNYCTNTFELSLQSVDGRPLNYLDPIPAEGATVRFEIRRVSGTTLLYGDDQMNRVYVTSGAFDDQGLQSPSTIRLETVESGDRWAAVLPISDVPVGEGSITRRFYISWGALPTDETTRQVHYAIQLELSIEEGKIAPASDLWMGCLFAPAKVIPAEDKRIPFCEWFDWRPLPVIDGPQTTNLKLLGVLDHRPELKDASAAATEDRNPLDAPPPPALPTAE